MQGMTVPIFDYGDSEGAEDRGMLKDAVCGDNIEDRPLSLEVKEPLIDKRRDNFPHSISQHDGQVSEVDSSFQKLHMHEDERCTNGDISSKSHDCLRGSGVTVPSKYETGGDESDLLLGKELVEVQRRRAALTAVLFLVERDSLTEQELSVWAAPLSGEELMQAAEERALAGRCGNPTCSKPYMWGAAGPSAILRHKLMHGIRATVEDGELEELNSSKRRVSGRHAAITAKLNSAAVHSDEDEGAEPDGREDWDTEHEDGNCEGEEEEEQEEVDGDDDAGVDALVLPEAKGGEELYINAQPSRHSTKRSSTLLAAPHVEDDMAAQCCCSVSCQRMLRGYSVQLGDPLKRLQPPAWKQVLAAAETAAGEGPSAAMASMAAAPSHAPRHGVAAGGQYGENKGVAARGARGTVTMLAEVKERMPSGSHLLPTTDKPERDDADLSTSQSSQVMGHVPLSNSVEGYMPKTFSGLTKDSDIGRLSSVTNPVVTPKQVIGGLTTSIRSASATRPPPDSATRYTTADPSLKRCSSAMPAGYSSFCASLLPARGILKKLPDDEKPSCIHLSHSRWRDNAALKRSISFNHVVECRVDELSDDASSAWTPDISRFHYFPPLGPPHPPPHCEATAMDLADDSSSSSSSKRSSYIFTELLKDSPCRPLLGAGQRFVRLPPPSLAGGRQVVIVPREKRATSEAAALRQQQGGLAAVSEHPEDISRAGLSSSLDNPSLLGNVIERPVGPSICHTAGLSPAGQCVTTHNNRDHHVQGSTSTPKVVIVPRRAIVAGRAAPAAAAPLTSQLPRSTSSSATAPDTASPALVASDTSSTSSSTTAPDTASPALVASDTSSTLTGVSNSPQLQLRMGSDDDVEVRTASGKQESADPVSENLAQTSHLSHESGRGGPGDTQAAGMNTVLAAEAGVKDVLAAEAGVKDVLAAEAGVKDVLAAEAGVKDVLAAEAGVKDVLAAEAGVKDVLAAQGEGFEASSSGIVKGEAPTSLSASTPAAFSTVEAEFSTAEAAKGGHTIAVDAPSGRQHYVVKRPKPVFRPGLPSRHAGRGGVILLETPPDLNFKQSPMEKFLLKSSSQTLQPLSPGPGRSRGTEAEPSVLYYPQAESSASPSLNACSSDVQKGPGGVVVIRGSHGADNALERERRRQARLDAQAHGLLVEHMHVDYCRSAGYEGREVGEVGAEEEDEDRQDVEDGSHSFVTRVTSGHPQGDKENTVDNDDDDDDDNNEVCGQPAIQSGVHNEAEVGACLQNSCTTESSQVVTHFVLGGGVTTARDSTEMGHQGGSGRSFTVLDPLSRSLITDDHDHGLNPEDDLSLNPEDDLSLNPELGSLGPEADPRRLGEHLIDAIAEDGDSDQEEDDDEVEVLDCTNRHAAGSYHDYDITATSSTRQGGGLIVEEAEIIGESVHSGGDDYDAYEEEEDDTSPAAPFFSDPPKEFRLEVSPFMELWSVVSGWLTVYSIEYLCADSDAEAKTALTEAVSKFGGAIAAFSTAAAADGTAGHRQQVAGPIITSKNVPPAGSGAAVYNVREAVLMLLLRAVQDVAGTLGMPVKDRVSVETKVQLYVQTLCFPFGGEVGRSTTRVALPKDQRLWQLLSLALMMALSRERLPGLWENDCDGGDDCSKVKGGQDNPEAGSPGGAAHHHEGMQRVLSGLGFHKVHVISLEELLLGQG
ncbi:hypothetical protein CEUSTIGMA_g4817.t1 [Chlamydomonas eustigma]|uniref:protein-serine/threonine phosphatase n=1 Tax=Chlamydomonas eustigma TaxID=1157962 RepID=A0A250X2T2_9CHLO|nr:hypothetical protein CEUSTIGMA_g4817.t1 [Chlamydomonas eustigma]|eukprot:GAX77371.1 hypothetical protein CEUSTIGMA_g4817.t1 [Chlamydomonas eustigma]